ncbi:MAG: hypothetical protein DMG61_05775 [Acidobacteria bacterium]|nr:MAG: hypothetical protein DMG61_05775 [Acidobacteriota bacterium]
MGRRFPRDDCRQLRPPASIPLQERHDQPHRFVLVSDGILDAVGPSGEQFGPKRVEEVIQQCCRMQAREIVQSIFDAVDKHRGTRATFDDETVLALKVK